MSMHMIRGVQVHGKSKPKKKPGWEKAEQEHRAWLLKMGVNPDAKVKKKKEFVPYEAPKGVKPYVRDTTNYPSLQTKSTPESCAKKESPKYTGTKMLGIGQLHKSNAVPVFCDQDAIDIAKMRRG
jgi:hypothetical protein